MNNLSSDRLSEVISIWSIQEGLLQQYRSIFITMQSIFFAVATSIYSKNSTSWVPVLLLFILAMFSLWLWLTICNRRGIAVFACQYMALKVESGECIPNPVTCLKNIEDAEYVDSKFSNDPLFKSLKVNRTRTLMQIALPAVFIFCWIFLWVGIMQDNWQLIYVNR